MLDYHLERATRISQFARHLSGMHARAHHEAHGPCFMIFSENKPDGLGDEKTLAESARPEMETVLERFTLAGIQSMPHLDSPIPLEIPGEGWKQDDSGSRYVQFSFEEKWFCIDIPRDTLFRFEGETIMKQRQGFFYLCDRPQFTLYGEDVEGHDPVRKIYLYGDEESAAQDMAYIFFQLWRFPVDSPLYVKACAFGGKYDWEDYDPI